MSISKKYYLNSVSIVIVVLLLASCAAPKVRQNVLMPANSVGLQNAKKIAVIHISGDREEEFSNKLETFFTNLQVNNKPYFTVIDQHARNSILVEREMQIEQGALLGNDAMQFGQLSGADTLISGYVKWPTFTNKSYTEQRTKCVQKATEESKGLLPGTKYRKCLKKAKYNVNCNKMKGKFNFTIKAVSVQTGKVVHTKNYTTVSEDKHCSDSSTAQKEPASVGEILVDQAIAKMRTDVAPYMMLVTIELMDDDDSDLGNNKHAQKLLESGIEFAKGSQMKRACSLFDEASKSYQHSPAIFHNLGVCAEMKKEFSLATSLYQKANNLLKKPEKLINAALARVSNRVQKEKMVQKQLR